MRQAQKKKVDTFIVTVYRERVRLVERSRSEIREAPVRSHQRSEKLPL